MSRLNVSQIIARYQAGFGYVAANLASIAGNRVWGKLIDIPFYVMEDSKFSNIKFIHQNTDKVFGFGTESSLKNNGNDALFEYMAPAPMVSFSRDKNVVRTPIDRSEIEVIEYFGLKPFEISIQGILVDMADHKYPKSLVRLINEMFTLPGTFKVESELFLDLGIKEVFFDGGFEIGFVEGFADTVKYSVKAISTMPAEIKTIGF